MRTAAGFALVLALAGCASPRPRPEPAALETRGELPPHVVEVAYGLYPCERDPSAPVYKPRAYTTPSSWTCSAESLRVTANPTAILSVSGCARALGLGEVDLV